MRRYTQDGRSKQSICSFQILIYLGVLLNEVFGVNADKSGYFSFLKDKIVEEYKEKECEKEVLVQRCLDKFGGELGMEARALLPYIIDEALSEIEEK